MKNKYKPIILSNCIQKEEKRFLWWRWKREITKHEWRYCVAGNNKMRRCAICSKNQILFKITYDGSAIASEDWRDGL